MSSDSTDEGEVSHYAYLVLRIFPPFTTEIAFFWLLTKPLILIEASTSFTNLLIWGCILLPYSDLTSPKCVSFRKISLILLGYWQNFRGNCGTFHWLLTVLWPIQLHRWDCLFCDKLSIVSRLLLQVDILFVTTMLILKCFRIPPNRLKFCTTSIWMLDFFLLSFRLKLWCCVTIGNWIMCVPMET
jgi:hypothetical protein